MGNCKTCKYWGVDRPGECDLVGRVDGEKTFEIQVRVADDHNLDYRLITGPNFGCINHIALWEKQDAEVQG